jgi:hypothetical protein
MSQQIQLNDYALTRLQIIWQQPALNTAIPQLRTDFGHGLAAHAQDAKRYKLDLKIRCFQQTQEAKAIGYTIEADISGFFTLPAEMEKKPHEEREHFTRVQGINLLYSTLRGLLGGMTGAFPGGKFILPTIMPQQIVEGWESAIRGARTKTVVKSKGTADQ